MLTRMHIEQALPKGYGLEDDTFEVGVKGFPIWDIVEEASGNKRRLGVPQFVLAWSEEQLVRNIHEDISALQRECVSGIVESTLVLQDYIPDTEETFREIELANDRKYY